jgi:sugar/nucleoside kinase (ribokinase family)
MKPELKALDDWYLHPAWPENRSWQMTGFGLNAVDCVCIIPFFPEHNTKMQIEKRMQMGGGQVATASALCSRYGLSVRYIGRVGEDEAGKFSLESLGQEKMDISSVETIKGSNSQFAVVLVDRLTGERTIIWERDAELTFRPEDVSSEWVTQTRLLHLDGHDEDAAVEAARIARDHGTLTCLDVDKIQPRVGELLKLIDFAIPTIGFLQRFTGLDGWKEGLLKVNEYTPGFTAVTLGEDGCAVVHEGRVVRVPGFQIEPTDTTGAGDVFHGAFLYGLFQNWSVLRILRFANAAGALACTRIGARPSIPTLEEVNCFLTSAKPAS